MIWNSALANIKLAGELKRQQKVFKQTYGLSVEDGPYKTKPIEHKSESSIGRKS